MSGMSLKIVIEGQKYERFKVNDTEGGGKAMWNWLNIRKEMTKPNLKHTNHLNVLDLEVIYWQGISQPRPSLGIDGKGRYGKWMESDIEGKIYHK